MVKIYANQNIAYNEAYTCIIFIYSTCLASMYRIAWTIVMWIIN